MHLDVWVDDISDVSFEFARTIIKRKTMTESTAKSPAGNGGLESKLLAAQVELKAPKSQYNNFGKYAYRSCEDILEAVKPICYKHGLTLTLSDDIRWVEGRTYVVAKATITDGQGTIVSTAFAREPESKKGMDEMQITGATSSYARKYALNALFAIDDSKDSDNDAYHPENTGSQSVPPASKQEKPAPAPGNSVPPGYDEFLAELERLAKEEGIQAMGKFWMQAQNSKFHALAAEKKEDLKKVAAATDKKKAAASV